MFTYKSRNIEIMQSFRDTAGHRCVAIIDETLAFKIVGEGRCPERLQVY